MVTLYTRVPSSIFLREFIVGTGLAKSMNEAKRLLSEGAIEVDGKKVSPDTRILLEEDRSCPECKKMVDPLRTGQCPECLKIADEIRGELEKCYVLLEDHGDNTTTWGWR